MTIFSVALLGNHPPSVNLVGVLYNLAWVTLGNAIAGAFFVAGAYWRADVPMQFKARTKRIATPEAAE
jgi:nitrite transporter NirC